MARWMCRACIIAGTTREERGLHLNAFMVTHKAFADGFTTLSPRQRLTASPYAITAGSLSGVVQSAGVSGAYSNAVMFSNPANTFAGDGSG